MKCDWTKENLILYIYDELADDARFEMENHIRNCAGCREELESVSTLKQDMSAMPVLEVSPNLLAASRMQLQESLEHAEQNRSGWGMFIFDFAGWMNQIKLAPALAHPLGLLKPDHAPLLVQSSLLAPCLSTILSTPVYSG